MAKLFPDKQTFVDLRDGDQVVVTKVTIVSSTSDFVSLPTAQDAAILNTTRTASDPTFYLTGRNTVFNIDGGTVGDEHLIVSRHSGVLNFDKGDQGDLTG